MVPTRELAQQIDEEFKGFARGSGFLSVCAVGGANINTQIRGLRADPYFVIGTPGRLKDLMDRRALDLSKFQTVVLDEADRMLDMGFIKDMRIHPFAHAARCGTRSFSPRRSRARSSVLSAIFSPTRCAFP